mgnify:CR=1 FL=1
MAKDVRLHEWSPAAPSQSSWRVPHPALRGRHCRWYAPTTKWATTAEEIWADTEGKVDAIVAGVGTGGTITGVVPARPTVQVFRDAQGGEGFNAVVRIEDHTRPDVTHYLWLDRIASVTPLGSA